MALMRGKLFAGALFAGALFGAATSPTPPIAPIQTLGFGGGGGGGSGSSNWPVVKAQAPVIGVIPQTILDDDDVILAAIVNAVTQGML